MASEALEASAELLFLFWLGEKEVATAETVAWTDAKIVPKRPWPPAVHLEGLFGGSWSIAVIISSFEWIE